MGRFQTVLAARERRRSRRYEVQVKALITTDDDIEQACTIHDISQTGALLEADGVAELTDFTLTVSRRCRVVRRSQDGKKIGVEFLVPWTVNP